MFSRGHPKEGPVEPGGKPGRQTGRYLVVRLVSADRMEADYLALYRWAQAVEAAGSIDVAAIQ